MYDLFISYSRSDLAWVEEELRPALKEIKATYFLDEAEWLKMRESIEAGGLQPGDDIRGKLMESLKSSRFIALIHSPAYFASKWCRAELEQAEKLAAESATAPDGLKLIYFILKKVEGRLDLSAAGERVLYVDLCDVLQRAEKLKFALKGVTQQEPAQSFRLGLRSLQDLLEKPEIRDQVEELRERHQEFRAAHARMQACKEVHDAIQRAQDAWRAVAKVRDELTAGKPASPSMMVADLAEKCSHIQAAFEAQTMQGEWGAWTATMKLAIDMLTAALADERNLEGLNRALELTKGLLFLSPIASEMNVKIRAASRELPIETLRKALAPLRALEKCPWQEVPLARLTKLTAEFDSLEKLLGDINDLVEVHDVLQNIDSTFAIAGDVEARLEMIEAVWPQIEAHRQKIQQRLLTANLWLKLLSTAADGMKDCLSRQPRLTTLPRQQVDFFKAQLNQSFTRADFDLRTETTWLEQRHNTIAELLLKMAKTN